MISSFHYTNVLSKTLQDPKLDLAAASELVDATIRTFHEYRAEAKWSGIWEESVSLAKACDVHIQPVPRRSSKTPSRLDDHMWGQLLMDPVMIYHMSVIIV